MIEAAASKSAAVEWQSATIVEIIRRTPRIKSFILALAKPFAFEAGQHVDVRLSAPDGYQAIRSYSLASAPGSSNHIELAIELLENGEVSPFFHDVAAAGDEIELRGPLGGHFIWPGSDGGPLLLAGGGSGVVPLMSMIRQRQMTAVAVPVLLLLSARHQSEVLYRDELLDLASRKNGFGFVLTLTREPPTRPGDYGRRVDASMMADILVRLPSPPKHIFVCGSNAFVNAATDAMLAAKLPPEIIKTERYRV
jgi:ferredoxin-NADP reductase